MTIKDGIVADDSGRKQALLAAGGLLGALAASSCCVLPLVLFSLGVVPIAGALGEMPFTQEFPKKYPREPLADQATQYKIASGMA
jgi:hypothetical protein